jgi:precorrin-6A/cobalt-precorrin-6A reductase
VDSGRVLVLGGTAPARRLAELLTAEGVRVLTSLAGRTTSPTLPAGDVRIGGFGGPDGLADWLRTHPVDAVIDATHPFAATITANAATATATVGVPFVVLRRPGWQPGPGEHWHWVDSLAAANDLLPDLGARVFLTTGRGDLAAFAGRDDLWFLLRAVEPPPPPLPARHVVVTARGPFDVEGELALLREHRIDVLVTRDSGGEHTAAKLVAARRLALPVVIARRPALPDVPVVADEAAAIEWLAVHMYI